MISFVTRTLCFALLGSMLAVTAARADIDRAAVDFIVPADIQWVKSPNGSSESAVLFGDPTKAGPYVMRIKWLPGNFSRPHVHPNDRFFIVISGTWWVGTGETFDPDSTVPVQAGSHVIHFANQAHYDGAKDGEAVIQVWGMGPATTTSVEKKP
jgi:mannose-6-phosphate isomerase-like protein (cupin superfamily)